MFEEMWVYYKNRNSLDCRNKNGKKENECSLWRKKNSKKLVCLIFLYICSKWNICFVHKSEFDHKYHKEDRPLSEMKFAREQVVPISLLI